MTEIVRLTLIPIIADASVSWATARIAFPWRVELTNQLRTASAGTMIARAITSFHVKRDVTDRRRRRPAESARSRSRSPTPYSPSETFWTMNDIPTAVISGATRGALRNGR